MFPWPVTLEAEVQSQGCLCYLGRTEWHQDRFLSQYFITSMTVFPPAVHSHGKWPQQLMVVLNNAHNKGISLDTEGMYMWQMCCTRLSSVEPTFVCLSKSPVNKTTSRFSSGVPSGERCSFSEPSLTYPLGSLVKDLRAPIERDFPEPSICLSKSPW